MRPSPTPRRSGAIRRINSAPITGCWSPNNALGLPIASLRRAAVLPDFLQRLDHDRIGRQPLIQGRRDWAAAARAGSSGDWLYLEGGPAAAAGATGAQLAETCEGGPAVNVHWPGRSTEDLRAVNITHSIMLRQYS